ncbi:MAG: prenyltransferase/squalene oxidase repeat-containing protein [Verrucomicrobiota bacterium]|nr:prenyltransferase/squalene oxidase repeat-containing protein [Verrucomicrobiota bacterium]
MNQLRHLYHLLWLFALIPTISSRSLAQELFSEQTATAANEIERMYVRGLQFLSQTQQPDGSWEDKPYGAEPAVVGLAIVAILAHGEDATSGPYAETIRRGLDFILKQQNPQTGYIGRSMYNHGFATLALAEAYGMVEDPRLGPALQKAVLLITGSQSKNPFGAWRYSPESTDADTTVSGAQMVALFAARNAGIGVAEEAIQKGLKFFARCQTPEGGIGYTAGTSPNGARSAIAVLVFALAKEKNSPVFKGAYNFLKTAPAENHYQQYYIYYAAQAFFHASPQGWNEWNKKNIRELTGSQNPDGSWTGQFGNSFSTAASLLSLAVNYRFLPIYER